MYYRGMRRTHGQREVARVLLANPDRVHYGYTLSRESNQRSATVYRMLTRMLEAGWISDGWEDPASTGRPPRRYYRVTDLGREQLPTLVEEQ